jgi:antitoxin HicB
MQYPATIEQDEDGQFIVSFRDVPEALTSGETLEEALAEAVDCLVVALDGYVATASAVFADPSGGTRGRGAAPDRGQADTP